MLVVVERVPWVATVKQLVEVKQKEEKMKSIIYLLTKLSNFSPSVKRRWLFKSSLCTYFMSSCNLATLSLESNPENN